MTPRLHRDRRLRDAVDHLRAAIICTGAALALVLTVPAPWNRIFCIGLIVAGITFAAVAPRPHP